MNGPTFELTAPSGTWVKDAACGGRWDLMEAIDEDGERHAKALCRSCPVLQDCGEWVLALKQRYDVEGVAAAMTHGERAHTRRKIARHRRALQAKAQPKTCHECALPKPRSEYYPRAGYADGLDNWCRTCRNAARTQLRRAARREKANA